MNNYSDDRFINKTIKHRFVVNSISLVFAILAWVALIYAVFIPFSDLDIFEKVTYFVLGAIACYLFSVANSLLNQVNDYVENWEACCFLLGQNIDEKHNLISMYKILEGNENDDTKKDSN